MLVLQPAYQHEVSPETVNYILRLSRLRNIEYHWIHRSPTAAARNELMTRAMRARRHSVALWLDARVVPGVDPDEMTIMVHKLIDNGWGVYGSPYEHNFDNDPYSSGLFGFECALMNLRLYRQRWVFGPWFDHSNPALGEGKRHVQIARRRQLVCKRMGTRFSRKATR